MMDDVYDIKAMQELAKATGAQFCVGRPGDSPHVTRDGKRQVVKALDSDGWDLWVPKRKPKAYLKSKLIEDMTPWKLNASIEMAMMFLDGFTKDAVMRKG